jgi:YD repeat-containing protein
LYDKLGRVIDIVYSNDTDSLDYQGGGLTKNNNPRPQNPKRHIDYGDNIGNLFATEIDPVGSKRTLQFDDFGQLVRVVTFDPAEKQTSSAQFSYNRWGQIAATTDQNGKTTHHEYDAMGRQTKIIYPDDTAGDADNPFKEFVYNYQTNELTSYDELRNRTLTQYDMAGDCDDKFYQYQ